VGADRCGGYDATRDFRSGPREKDNLSALAQVEADRKSIESNACEKLHFAAPGKPRDRSRPRTAKHIAEKPTEHAAAETAKSAARQRYTPGSTSALKSKILKHWKRWLPIKYGRLKAEGTLDKEAQARAVNAQQEIEAQYCRRKPGRLVARSRPNGPSNVLRTCDR
jgi:hypothetical protein